MTRPSRLRARRLALAAIALWVLPLAAPVAAAAEPAAVGWWWAGRPSASFPLAFSPVPDVPEGGFYVAGDFTGPSGVSALRFELGPDDEPQTLTITVADSIGTPGVDACAADGEWEAADEGGAWDERAGADCDTTRASGTLSEDRTTISFDMFAFDADGTLDVVLVPGEDPEGGQPPTFSASFEPPGPEALTVWELPAASPPAPRGPEPSAGSDGESATLPVPSGSPPSFAPDPAPAPPVAPRDDASQPVAAPLQTNPAFTEFPAAEGFAYPAILGLPLAMLVLGSYLARSLTRPVAVRLGPPS